MTPEFSVWWGSCSGRVAVAEKGSLIPIQDVWSCVKEPTPWYTWTRTKFFFLVGTFWQFSIQRTLVLVWKAASCCQRAWQTHFSVRMFSHQCGGSGMNVKREEYGRPQMTLRSCSLPDWFAWHFHMKAEPCALLVWQGVGKVCRACRSPMRLRLRSLRTWSSFWLEPLCSWSNQIKTLWHKAYTCAWEPCVLAFCVQRRYGSMPKQKICGTSRSSFCKVVNVNLLEPWCEPLSPPDLSFVRRFLLASYVCVLLWEMHLMEQRSFPNVPQSHHLESRRNKD